MSPCQPPLLQLLKNSGRKHPKADRKPCRSGRFRISSGSSSATRTSSCPGRESSPSRRRALGARQRREAAGTFPVSFPGCEDPRCQRGRPGGGVLITQVIRSYATGEGSPRYPSPRPMQLGPPHRGAAPGSGIQGEWRDQPQTGPTHRVALRARGRTGCAALAPLRECVCLCPNWGAKREGER